LLYKFVVVEIAVYIFSNDRFDDGPHEIFV
jgi:hypothetical protein